MKTEENPLAQFRYIVYQNFNKRADVLLDLLDALCSGAPARSVAELSLSPYFRRGYSALYKGLDAYALGSSSLAHLAAPYLVVPQQRSFWLLGTDVTTVARLYSRTLADRSYVYQPTPIRGNMPITIGHAYSTVVLLPEKVSGQEPPWAPPLSVRRVASDQDKEGVGDAQLRELLNDPAMPFHGQLCVSSRDSRYSKPASLYAEREHDNLVSVTRVRSNRVFYRQYVPPADAKPAPGHPRWYGDRFALPEPETWGPPDEETTCTLTRQGGQVYRAELRAWHNLLMRGKRKPLPLPMHCYPFTLVHVQVYRADGSLLYRRPLWVLIMGARRAEIPLVQAYQAYDQRFDIEHGYRFCKQHLLLTAYQTPDVEHEEKWWEFVHLAYLQLWVARDFAQRWPRPWERYLPTMQADTPLTPTLVQRDFGHIIQQLGTPAQPAKLRGNAPGRAPGTSQPAREPQPVVKKRSAA